MTKENLSTIFILIAAYAPVSTHPIINHHSHICSQILHAELIWLEVSLKQVKIINFFVNPCNKFEANKHPKMIDLLTLGWALMEWIWQLKEKIYQTTLHSPYHGVKFSWKWKIMINTSILYVYRVPWRVATQIPSSWMSSVRLDVSCPSYLCFWLFSHTWYTSKL